MNIINMIKELEFNRLLDISFAFKFLLLWLISTYLFFKIKMWFNHSPHLSDYRSFYLPSFDFFIFRNAQNTESTFLYIVAFTVFAFYTLSIGLLCYVLLLIFTS